MTQDVTLSLDDFSRQAFERFARRGDGSPEQALRTASLYYLADREAGRPAWRVPDFALETPAEHTLTLEIDDATWEALSEEASDQGVSLETLALHAVLYLLADIDSGRLVTNLEDALDRADR